MTPEQKLKYAIIARACEMDRVELPQYPCDNVDELWEKAFAEDRKTDSIYDAMEEVRTSGDETQLHSLRGYSRHYESDAVAMQMPDGTWVGWTYWYGGGKHSEPSSMPWLEGAYNLDCKEERVMMTKRTFTKAET